jgi:hypothetical protein
MKRRILLISLAVMVGLIFSLLYYLYGGSAAPAGQAPLVRVNSANLSSLKESFNGSANSVRVLVMLSPT